MANPKKLLATIDSITKHTEDVYTIDMSFEKRKPRFKAGQFLHLTLDEFDPTRGFWPESRVFSIASAPQDDFISISYSVKGKYTSRMRDELKTGKEVWLKFPYGDFIISRIVEDQAPLVLIAGGTGITPFISYLKEEVLEPGQRKIDLFYGFKNQDLYLYQDLIDECRKNLPGFRAFIFQEEISEQGDHEYPVIPGRLSYEQLKSNREHDLSSTFFIAGPPVMMDYFKDQLSADKVDDEHIIIDEWE